MRRSILAPIQKLFLFLSLVFATAPALVPAHAQASPPAATAAGQSAAPTQKPEQKPDSDSSDQYRHSAAVRFVARTLHLPTETTAKAFEYLNFAILAGSILYFVFKFVPKLFRGRRDALAKQLVDARSATEQAKERLSGVEARLSRLDDEIAAIRKQVEQDAAQDEIRIKAALEEDKKRIAEAAGQAVESAGASAQRELRKFAAELAVERAIKNLSLTAEIDRRLVSNFSGELVGDAGDKFKGGRN